MKIYIEENIVYSRKMSKEISEEKIVEVIGENPDVFDEYLEVEDISAEDYVAKYFPDFEEDFISELAELMDVYSDGELEEHYDDPYEVVSGIEE